MLWGQDETYIDPFTITNENVSSTIKRASTCAITKTPLFKSTYRDELENREMIFNAKVHLRTTEMTTTMSPETLDKPEGPSQQTHWDPFYMVTGVCSAVFLAGLVFTPNFRPYTAVVRTTVMMSAFCFWFLWSSVYFSSMNPLETPLMEPSSLAWLAHVWGNQPGASQTTTTNNNKTNVLREKGASATTTMTSATSTTATTTTTTTPTATTMTTTTTTATTMTTTTMTTTITTTTTTTTIIVPRGVCVIWWWHPMKCYGT